jgi:hypothetical protein
MKIEDAMEKAIEGGFEQNYAHYANAGIKAITLLDSSFWRSLGKALGWEGKEWSCQCGFRHEYFSKHDNTFCPRDGKKLALVDAENGEWIRRWHDFIDHLAEGKTAEEFFGELS